ncbi:MAG: translation elongation factor 4 [Candidatus Eremiobacteraeota bacterium]|nr:translation elongation factor 4 [Candidatus Eremiobacteraeota bacterium]MCW5872759.1 translation elongation factor 4 [Candidatus Eremiobacteraeota bacterium]
MSSQNVRNFCIIAHIDHGKSTLADRLLEMTGTLTKREMAEQVLDSMDLERERGITIKSHPVTLRYQAKDGVEYQLNLIDTPGHVDFTYEVSRSLAACEGALLVVDAAQGVEAQTMANYFLAMSQNLTIVPVINKIDLPAADPDRVRHEIEEVLALPADDAVAISAKQGIGIEDVLEAVVRLIPPPRGDKNKPLRALIFDSHFDQYRGVVPVFRVVDGEMRKGTKIRMMSTNSVFEVDEVGMFRPSQFPVESLKAGDTGYLTAQIRTISETRVGDTITLAEGGASEVLPGYREVQPMVYCGLYPIDSVDYVNLKDALGKLKLNDAALVWEPETSVALGFGYRCGFLGLLHMEIVQERLEREFNLNLIATSPSVIYDIHKKDGSVITIQNPTDLPPVNDIDYIEEPVVNATIITPELYVGQIMDLAQGRRGTFKNMEYPSDGRCTLHYELPLGEIITDFFDQLKSRTRGYASLDYEMAGTRQSDLVRLDILVNAEKVDALSVIVHTDKAYYVGRALTEKLKEVIPRQQFEVPIQATLGSKVIARENVKALRKNVLAKCYGGDISRKRKLLEKQKEGKKRMKRVGNVEIPQEAFLAVLDLEGED